MNNPQEILFNSYSRLLGEFPEKWVKAAGDVCFMFIDNGLSICYYLDRDNTKCISLYTIDNNGSINDEIIIREKETPDVYNRFLQVFNQIKAQASANRFTALEKKITNYAA